jgi:uncharacterized protein (TIGR04255 family)
MIQSPSEMPNLPKKLKQDAIVEAVLEIRFEHQNVPEVVVGRLAAASEWAGYQTVRLPIAELPAGVREADPDLKYQPIIQLQRPTPGEIVRIGPRTLSMHVLSPYPGWATFESRLSILVDELFQAVPTPYISRLGLKYVNAITPAHGVGAISDLAFRLEVAGAQPSTELTASYRFSPRPGVRAQVTLASPAFVAGMVPSAVVFVDVDMSTPAPIGQASREVLLSWVAEAHDAEKEAFFALWPQQILNSLRED